MLVSRNTFTTVTIVVILGIFAATAGLLRPAVYYPYLDIVWPEVLRIQILQRGHAQGSECARSLASQLAAIKNTCPLCRIEKNECRTKLAVGMREWFEEEPMQMPSARMAYGVIVFESQQQQIALAACQESEKQSAANPPTSKVTCFPAGNSRKQLQIESELAERENAERRESIVSAALAIIGFIALMLTISALLRQFATNAPAEEVGTITAPDQYASIKISNALKRAFDITFALALLIALLPVFVVIAALILVLEGSPVFYMSRRFITAEKSVIIYKFRTMVKDATSPKYQLRERYMRDGYLDIPISCEVYTRIGRVLERSQFVETLQLLNILFDGMSFVGNRPLPKDNIELLKKFEGWQGRFASPAGITGISQIVGKYELLPQQRISLEQMYASIYTNPKGNIFLCDMYILGYTLYLLFTGRYLSYDKAVALLVRHGADQSLMWPA